VSPNRVQEKDHLTSSSCKRNKS